LSWTDRGVSKTLEPKRQLRSFGLIAGGLLGVLAVWPQLVYGNQMRMWAIVLGLLFALSGLTVPAILRYPYRGWMFLGHCLGWLNTRIILTVLFFAVFTPVSFLMRLLKRDAMGRKFDRSVDTYRVTKKSRSASDLTHQF
jgi:hypothetical protein